jgi:hypothetical protein
MNTLIEAYNYSCEVAKNDNMERYCSDKGTAHSYIEIYESLFQKYKDRPVNILEIGVNKGYSLFTWKNYFSNAKNIVGIDYQPGIVYKTEDFKIIYGDINNRSFINNSLGNMTFDIIIDDGSHMVQDQLTALSLLYPRLNSGGIFIIEDIQNLENDLPKFNFFPPKVYDLRSIKQRWDDVLFVWEK